MKYPINFEISFKKNTLPGKFIVFEGIDGSGKTTQAQILFETLKKQGKEVVLTKSPTDEKIGKFIRQILSGEEKVSPIALQYLFVADRADHVAQTEKWLSKGIAVISDRYFWSSVAYGIADMKRPVDVLLSAYSILSSYYQFVVPDITFYLDIPVDVGVKRVANKKMLEIYENKKMLETVKDTYDLLLARFPEEFTILDGTKKMDEVEKDVIEKVKNLL